MTSHSVGSDQLSLLLSVRWEMSSNLWATWWRLSVADWERWHVCLLQTAGSIVR